MHETPEWRWYVVSWPFVSLVLRILKRWPSVQDPNSRKVLHFSVARLLRARTWSFTFCVVREEAFTVSLLRRRREKYQHLVYTCWRVAERSPAAKGSSGSRSSPGIPCSHPRAALLRACTQHWRAWVCGWALVRYGGFTDGSLLAGRPPPGVPCQRDLSRLCHKAHPVPQGSVQPPVRAWINATVT